MRLAALSLDVLDVPLRSTLATGIGEQRTVRLGLVSLRTDTGLTGLGEVALEGVEAAGGVLEAALADVSAPRLAEGLGVPLAGVDLGDERAVVACLTTILG